MRERLGVDHIFNSDSSTEMNERAQKHIANTFESQDFKDFKDVELEKTLEQLAILDLNNQVLNQWRERFALPPFTVPEKNVHLLPREAWAAEGKNGMFRVSRQGIALRQQDSNLEFAETSFHEMMHFHSYTAVEALPERLVDYRFGFEVLERPGLHRHFTPLNEGITAELTKRFIVEHLNHPLFAAEHAMTEKLRAEDPEAMSTKNNRLFTEETFFATIKPRPDGKPTLFTNKISYAPARQALHLLSEAVAQHHVRPISKEQAMDHFFKAAFTGNLLPIAKVLERTYGRGTFRRLGQITEEDLFLQAVQELVATNSA